MSKTLPKNKEQDIQHGRRRRVISPVSKEAQYWFATRKLLTIILVLWFFVSIGLSIVFAPLLNAIKLGGYPLGFWFAQQGSIYIFIALIFIYAYLMNKIDHKFDFHEE